MLCATNALQCGANVEILQKENSQNPLFIGFLRVFSEVPGGFEPP